MSVTSLLARALAVTMVGAPLALAAAPATAQPVYPTHLVVSRSPTGTVPYRTTVWIRGQVAYTNPQDGKQYAATGTVVLNRRLLGSSTWTRLGSRDMNQFWPRFDFYKVVATANAEYRLVFTGGPNDAGDATYSPSSTSLVIRVSRKITATGSEPRENVFYLSGTVTPRYAGKPIALMRKKCATCAWYVIATKRTTAYSRYSFRLPTPGSGTHYFRARVWRNTSYVTSFSPTWYVRHIR